MNDIYFSMFPTSEASIAWDWTAIGVMVSIVVAVGSFIVTQHRTSKDREYQRSLSYLEQIKSYFADAGSILSNCENNNVKWHQAIALLKIADVLKKHLSDKSHRHIYLIEYINCGYSIIDIIKNIGDFKFFYGVSDYQEKTSAMLFDEANPVRLENCRRISPDKLKDLCMFIDKANKRAYDLNEKDSEPKEVFCSDYFNEKIEPTNFLSGLSGRPTSITVYLEDFERHKENRWKNRYTKAELERV